MPSRGKIQRTKTFTGCATCRSRGVKCGEEKPTCLRCKKMGLQCGGYGVELVWPGNKGPKACQRRVILTGRESSVQAISDDDLSSILGTLDTTTPSTNFAVGPFGVFRASRTPPLRKTDELTCEVVSTVVTDSQFSAENRARANSPARNRSGSPPYSNEVSIPQLERKEKVAFLKKLRWRLGLVFLEPSLLESMPITSREDRQLMHYWITHLSQVIIPTERADNPFTSIIVPLAFSIADDPHDLSGCKALLHSVYSLSAYSRSSCGAFAKTNRSSQHALGSEHLQLAFKELGRSLVEASRKKPEAVLATILTLAIIAIFTDNYSNYRVHIRGGAEWIQSIDISIWKRNPDASAIYQIFTCIEALRPAHSILAGDLKPQELSLEHFALEKIHKNEPSSKNNGRPPNSRKPLNDTTYYCLDKVFSLTKPILECIMQINRLIFAGALPEDDEFVSLEFKIMANNPENIHFPGLEPTFEKISHHHACILYCATYIYYKRFLLRLPASGVEWLVRQNIEHLDAIELLAVNMNVSGLLWPLFITGCEAVDEDLRAKILFYFDRRERLGIANVLAARKVMNEVWKRRDEGVSDVSWHEVMAELGIDILLA